MWVGFLHADNDVFKSLAKIGFLYPVFLAGLEIDIQKFLVYKDRFVKKHLIFSLPLWHLFSSVFDFRLISCVYRGYSYCLFRDDYGAD